MIRYNRLFFLVVIVAFSITAQADPRKPSDHPTKPPVSHHGSQSKSATLAPTPATSQTSQLSSSKTASSAPTASSVPSASQAATATSRPTASPVPSTSQVATATSRPTDSAVPSATMTATATPVPSRPATPSVSQAPSTTTSWSSQATPTVSGAPSQNPSPYTTVITPTPTTVASTGVPSSTNVPSAVPTPLPSSYASPSPCLSGLPTLTPNANASTPSPSALPANVAACLTLLNLTEALTGYALEADSKHVIPSAVPNIPVQAWLVKLQPIWLAAQSCNPSDSYDLDTNCRLSQPLGYNLSDANCTALLEGLPAETFVSQLSALILCGIKWKVMAPVACTSAAPPLVASLGLLVSTLVIFLS